MASFKIAKVMAQAMADAAGSAVDAGTPDSTLVIYNGSEPADLETAIGAQVALVTFPLPADAFGAAAVVGNTAVITLNAVAAVDASADGTASWFRIIDGNGVALMQGNVTDTTGTGVCKVSSTAIISGISVEIVSATFAQPTGVGV